MPSKADKIDFGSWTDDEMKELLKRLVSEMKVEDVVEVVKEQEIFDFE